MIDIIEVHNSSLNSLGLIDTAKSIIWETQYFGAGAFEVYCEATPAAVSMLQVGNFITRLDGEGVGIIEAINVTFDGNDGRMITASGRLAKSILDRRLITYVKGDASAATLFSGNVEQRARGLVQDNAIACYKDKRRAIPYNERNIHILQLGDLANLPAETPERRANGENLLTYTDDFLKQYGYGAKLIRVGNKLAYTVYAGTDRSIGNAEGNQPVIFSQDFDNLNGSDYSFDENGCKSFALVGGKEDDGERFFAECNAELSGLERRELFVDTSIEREVYEDSFTGDGGTVTDGTRVFALPATATGIRSATIDGKEQSYAFYPTDHSIGFMTVPLAGAKIVVQYYTSEVYNEEFTGVAPAETKTFVLKNKASWIESVTVNSISQEYEFDSSAMSVTFDDAPADGAKIVVIYGDGKNKFTDVFYGSKVEQTTFTLKHAATQIVRCLVDGVSKSCEFDIHKGTITLDPAPKKGAKIKVEYVAGNEYFTANFTGDGISSPVEGSGTTTFYLSHAATDILSVTVAGSYAKYSFDVGKNAIVFASAPLEGTAILVSYVDNNEYRAQLREAGRQELATLIAVEGFNGTVDLTNSSFEYGIDFSIGDIVTVQDNGINKYVNARVVGVTEVQDDDGYQVNLNFEAV